MLRPDVRLTINVNQTYGSKNPARNSGTNKNTINMQKINSIFHPEIFFWVSKFSFSEAFGVPVGKARILNANVATAIRDVDPK